MNIPVSAGSAELSLEYFPSAVMRFPIVAETITLVAEQITSVVEAITLVAEAITMAVKTIWHAGWRSKSGGADHYVAEIVFSQLKDYRL